MKIKLLIAISLTLFNYVIHAQAPDWIWATSAGGRFNDYNYINTIDANRNIIITGMYQDPTIKFGSTTLTNFSTGGGIGDIFVAKYDSGGNVLWAVSAGGNGDDQGLGVCTDSKGNVYVTGDFDSYSIIFGRDTFITKGVADVFVVKYDPNGHVIWARQAGSNSEDAGESISVDANGNVYVIGYFSGPSIIFGAFMLTNPTFRDAHIFVVKYDSSGNVIWADQARSYSADFPSAISADAYGNVYGAGYMQSDTVIFGTDTLFNKYKSAYNTIFLVKYDSSGNVKWARNPGDTSFNFTGGLAIDPDGNVIITGECDGPFIIFGADTLHYSPGNSLFVAKYDSTGNVLWAKGASGASGSHLATDIAGNIYCTGGYGTNQLIFGMDTLNNNGPPYSDIFVACYDMNGNILWGKGAGGSKNDGYGGISVDVSGDIYISGNFWSPSVVFGNDTVTNASYDTSDIFLAKLKGSITTNVEKMAKTGICVSEYPNPMCKQATWCADKNLSGATLTLYNVFGQMVKQINNISGHSVTLNRDNLPTGVYLYRLMGNDNVISTGKLVVSGD